VRREAVLGGVHATAAFALWGLAPAYWRLLGFVSSGEMAAQRVLWALPVTLLLVAARGRLREVGAALRDPGQRRVLAATALLIGANWLVFLWAVETSHVLESSLGYFVNPLVNVALGTVFLGERLRRAQAVAVALAGAGVLWLAVTHPGALWSALFLAATFAGYGLLRKSAPVDGLVGLAVETVLLAPFALGAVLFLLARGESGASSRGLEGLLLLASSGVVTSLPLWWFANAARGLRLTTLGFFQYLAPTGQFLLAVLAYGEPFTASHAVAFGLIWTAIAVFAADAVRAVRAESRAAPSPSLARASPAE
jgi:chloramphenicol-sensitive protein RarD